MISVGDLVHSNVFGPMYVSSLGKKLNFVTFINDSSRWCEVKFIRQKNKVLDEFEKYRAFVSTHVGKSIKYLQSDNGKEYVNKDFDELLRKYVISRRLTAPYNPEPNAVSERKNITLLDMQRGPGTTKSGQNSNFRPNCI